MKKAKSKKADRRGQKKPGEEIKCQENPPRRSVLLAGTAASATIGMPWIAKGAAEFQLKYANNSPVTHPLNVRAAEAMERIKQETNGRVEIQVFPNNQLGSDTDRSEERRVGKECR